jgi:FkbM family methyltransferase
LLEARWRGPLIISFAQNAEDVRLWRVLAQRVSGFYVDVGAGDPEIDSVTKLFYDAGWSGINVEPGPAHGALVGARPRDVNLKLAIGEEPGRRELWVTSPDSALSSFVEPDPASLPPGVSAERTIVDVDRLDAVIARHASDRPIDFLKIDAEGAEREAVASLDLRRVRPTIVLIEAITPLAGRPAHDEWEPLLLDADYAFAAFDGINRFYVRGEDDHLIPALAYPISALDRYETRAAAASRELVYEMESTFSWRVTRPLRLARRLQREVFRR